ncbi:hypothetical protein DRQ50_11225 [bacterium]|nr:MAG: hypothetical protein DRQ50_11225 [bacterium]
MNTHRFHNLRLLVVCLVLGAAAAVTAGEASSERAGWLLTRGTMTEFGPRDTRYFQDEIGGGSAFEQDAPTVQDTGRASNVGLKVLASAIFPGTGEALMGYKRGYVLMALDIFAWTQVFKNDKEGDEKLDEYYVFADLHYDDRRVVQAYTSSTTNPYADLGDYWLERRVGPAGLGGKYFVDEDDAPIIINDIDELHNLPLYVTKEEDRREYYENLGKWDQFVFGWDDFTRPESTIGPNPTYALSDLSKPEVSRNRETYRSMRKASNDAYKTRDRWLYLNIGLRVFSVIETAWLGGLLGGEGDEQMAVAGHRIQIVAVPRGAYRGTIGAKVWF